MPPEFWAAAARLARSRGVSLVSRTLRIVFCGRSRRAIKCLVYDGQGFWLLQKRLSQGRFAAWPMADPAASRGVDPHQLHALLWNGDPGAKNTAPLWRPVAVVGGK